MNRKQLPEYLPPLDLVSISLQFSAHVSCKLLPGQIIFNSFHWNEKGESQLVWQINADKNHNGRYHYFCVKPIAGEVEIWKLSLASTDYLTRLTEAKTFLIGL